MKFNIGEMSVGDILDRGLKILFARLPTFYLIYLIVMTPMMLYQLATPAVMEAMSQSGQGAAAVALPFLAGSLIAIILTAIFTPIGRAATLYVISQEFIGEKATLGEAFSFAVGRFGTLFVASLISGLIIGLGFLACIVPYIIFSLWWVFIAQVIVVENKGATESMARSKELGTGFRWRILGVLVLLGVIELVLTLPITLGLDALLPSAEIVTTEIGPRQVINNYPFYAIKIVAAYLAQVLATSYAATCVTLLYYDLRIRKEGFDLEMAARQQSRNPDQPPSPDASPEAPWMPEGQGDEERPPL